MVGATSVDLWNNAPSPFALLSPKSHCLKRKCWCTLAAETRIMSEALAELWNGQPGPGHRGLLVAALASDAEWRLPKVLSIGDAKFLYDHLRTETSGGDNDRRTAS